MVVDVDNMYIKMKNEENPLTKTVFHYLFRVSLDINKSAANSFELFSVFKNVCFNFEYIKGQKTT